MVNDKKIEVKIKEYPSINIKREVYKSSTITIVTDMPLDDKNKYGFLENDVPEYAK